MNGRTSILNDLAIDWKGNKPEWRSDVIPFVHPSETPLQPKVYSVPHVLITILMSYFSEGKCSQGLKTILEVIYKKFRNESLQNESYSFGF